MQLESLFRTWYNTQAVRPSRLMLCGITVLTLAFVGQGRSASLHVMDTHHEYAYVFLPALWLFLPMSLSLPLSLSSSLTMSQYHVVMC